MLAIQIFDPEGIGTCCVGLFTQSQLDYTITCINSIVIKLSFSRMINKVYNKVFDFRMCRTPETPLGYELVKK